MKNKLIKIIILTVYLLIAALLILCVISLSKMIYLYHSNFFLLTIESHSMQPFIKKNDVILLSKKKEYIQGDIISYKATKNKIITHRIVNKNMKNNNVSYVTKGDSNNVTDKEIHESQIIGKVVLIIPFIGIVKNFIFSYAGYSIYTGILLTIILGNFCYIALKFIRFVLKY